MQSWWHRYFKKTLLGHIAPSKKSMKANINFKPWVGNPTIALVWNQTSKRKNLRFHILNVQLVFFGFSYSENKTCSQNSAARAFKGRMSKLKRSWGHDGKSCLQIMNQKHTFFLITPWLLPIWTSFLWKLMPCSLTDPVKPVLFYKNLFSLIDSLIN